jgi:adiponectin receptor
LAVKAIALKYMIVMGLSYVVGALLYGSRIPERFFPGKVDYFGASHQIFHVLVLVGVWTHFVGVTKAMAFWHEVNDSCSIPIEQMRTMY